MHYFLYGLYIGPDYAETSWNHSLSICMIKMHENAPENIAKLVLVLENHHFCHETASDKLYIHRKNSALTAPFENNRFHILRRIFSIYYI